MIFMDVVVTAGGLVAAPLVGAICAPRKNGSHKGSLYKGVPLCRDRHAALSAP